MISEEFLLIGILDEKRAQGHVKLEELRSLICDHIQVAPYYPILIEVLTGKGVSFEEKTKIDIQLVFEAMDTAHFLRAIPSFYNKRISKYSIRLIKSGLVIYTRGFLTLKQIGEAASVHQMKEYENLSIGVPFTQETLESMLWIFGRTIASNVLVKWMEMHEDYLEVRDTMMAYEFLYFACNSKDRTEMFQKIPKLHMNPKMDKKIQLFHVDSEFHKTYKTPDFKMQHLLNMNYNVDKAIYEGVSQEKTKINTKTQKTKKLTMRVDPGTEDEISEFRKHLRSMLVTVEIKKRIKETNQKLAHLKLNGQAAYDQLAHTTVELPSPMAARDNQPAKPKPKPIKQLTIVTRPQTASIKPIEPQTCSSRLQHSKPEKSSFNFSVLKSPKDSSLNKPFTPSTLPTTSRLLSPRLLNNNSQIRIHTSYSSGDCIDFRPVSAYKGEKRNYDNSYFTGDSKADNLTNFESIIDEEYFRFENQVKSKESKIRPMTARYFNEESVKSHSTRLLSSKV